MYGVHGVSRELFYYFFKLLHLVIFFVLIVIGTMLFKISYVNIIRVIFNLFLLFNLFHNASKTIKHLLVLAFHLFILYSRKQYAFAFLRWLILRLDIYGSWWIWQRTLGTQLTRPLVFSFVEDRTYLNWLIELKRTLFIGISCLHLLLCVYYFIHILISYNIRFKFGALLALHELCVIKPFYYVQFLWALGSYWWVFFCCSFAFNFLIS